MEEIVAAIDEHDAVLEDALPLVLGARHLIVKTQNNVLDLFATIRVVVCVIRVVQVRVDIILLE